MGGNGGPVQVTGWSTHYFLNHAKGYPQQEAWALQWVNAIGELYHINNQRIVHKHGSAQFKQHDQALRKAIRVR